MNRLFGSGKPKAPAPNLNDCVSTLDARGETLEKKIGKLDEEIMKYKNQMKGMRDGPAKNAIKSKALRVLQQKKRYEAQREQVASQSFNMDQTNFAIQSMKDTHATVGAMKAGVKEFKREFKKMDIDQVDDLQDELADMLEESNDMQEILSRNFTMPELDDADLEAEFDALGDELGVDNAEGSSYLDDAIAAPTAPTADPSGNVAVDDFGLPQVAK